MFPVQIFEKIRKQELLIFQDVHRLNFLTDSGLVHLSDVSRMRSSISILKKSSN